MEIKLQKNVKKSYFNNLYDECINTKKTLRSEHFFSYTNDKAEYNRIIIFPRFFTIFLKSAILIDATAKESPVQQYQLFTIKEF